MNKFVLFLAAALFILSVDKGLAAPSKDHNVLRTLQSLKEKSLHKRLMNLSAMGPEAYKQLQDISFDSDYPPETRAEAFRTAVTLGQEKSLPEIMRAAEHKDWFMRVLALEAYGHIQPSKARTMARQWLLQDSAMMVRAAALGHLKEEPLTDELQEVLTLALKDQKNFHRGQSLWIRGRIGEMLLQLNPKGHPETYKSLLKDLDPKLRLQAVEKLRQAYPESSKKLKDSADASAWLGFLADFM